MKENIKLAFPILLGQLGFTAIGFIDNIMIGSLGTIYLSAFSLSNNILFLIYALNIGFVIMFTPLISRIYTSNNIEKPKIFFFNGIVIYIIFGFILFISLLILSINLSRFGQPKDVIEIAKPYFKILIFSFIPSFLFQILKQFSDGLSKPKTPMLCILASLLLNVILNYSLIFGKFGFPKCGLIGSAIGTLISRTFLLILLFIILKFQKETKIFFKNLLNYKFDFNIIKEIIKLGSFSSLQVFTKIGLFTSTVFLSGNLSPHIQASNQIILSISSIMFAVPFSLASASAIKTSSLFSEKNVFASSKSVNSFLLLSILTSIIFAIILMCLKEQIPTMYINDVSVIKTVSNTIIFLAIFQLISGVEIIILGTLKGLKDTIIPFFITIISYYFISLPTSFYLADKIGLIGIWIGLIIGLFISFSLLYYRIQMIYKKQYIFLKII